MNKNQFLLASAASYTFCPFIMKMLIKFKGRELSRILCLINFVPRKYSGARCAANLHFYTLNSHIDILSDFPSISPSIFISFLKSRCKQEGNINLIKQIQFAEQRTTLLCTNLAPAQNAAEQEIYRIIQSGWKEFPNIFTLSL